jgi:hypothetical protein
MLPMIASVGIAASRASVLEMAWVAGVMAVFLVRGRGFRMRRVVGYAALVALIAAAVILALSTGPSAIFLGKLGAAFHSRELHVRYVEWEAALRAWMAAPWFGVGAGGYPWAQFTTETPWAGEVRMLPETHAHNFILHLLAETGLVGAVVALIALVPWLWRICRTMLQPGDTAGPAWVLAVVGIELLHSLVEYPLWNVEFLGLAALAAGLGGEARVLPRAMTGIRLIACGGALLGAALLGRTVYAFGFLERAWFGAALPEQVAEARKSLLRPYVDLGLAQQVPLTRADLSAKLVFNSRAVMTWPVAPVVMRQIVLLAMAGRDEEAKVYLHRLSRLNRAYLADLRTMVEAVSLDDLPAASPLRSLVHAEST